MSVVDVKMIERFVDQFVFVVEWGETKRDIVVDALSDAEIIRDRIAGVVLNKADPVALQTMSKPSTASGPAIIIRTEPREAAGHMRPAQPARGAGTRSPARSPAIHRAFFASRAQCCPIPTSRQKSQSFHGINRSLKHERIIIFMVSV